MRLFFTAMIGIISLWVGLASAQPVSPSLYDALDQRLELIREMEDQALADEISEYLSFSVISLGSFSMMTADPPVLNFVENLLPLSLFTQYKDPATLTHAYAQSRLIGSLGRLTIGSSHSGHAMNFIEPFEHPYSVNFAWDNVVMADGGLLPITGSFDGDAATTQAQAESSFGPVAIHVIYPAGTMANPNMISVTGTYTADVPTDFVTATIHTGDVGQPIDLGDFQVTLTEVGSHFVMLRATPKNNETRAWVQGYQSQESEPIFAIRGLDAQGRHLRAHLAYMGPGDISLAKREAAIASVFALTDGILASYEAGNSVTADMIKEQFTTWFEENDPRDMVDETQVTALGTFSGPLDSIEVILLQSPEMQSISGEVTVPLTETDRRALRMYASGDLPLPKLELDVFAEGPNTFADIAEVDVENLAQAITHEHRYDENRYPEGNVAFAYPRTMSSLLFGIDNRFYRRGDLIWEDGSGSKIDIGPDSGRNYEFERSVLEYNLRTFPQQPRRVKGDLIVLMTPDVSITQHTLDKLPDGIRVDGNILIDERSPDDHGRVFVRDTDGAYIKTLVGFYNGSPTEENRSATEIYYKTIHTVEILHPGEVGEVPYAFDIEIPPLEQLDVIAR